LVSFLWACSEKFISFVGFTHSFFLGYLRGRWTIPRCCSKLKMPSSARTIIPSSATRCPCRLASLLLLECPPLLEEVSFKLCLYTVSSIANHTAMRCPMPRLPYPFLLLGAVVFTPEQKEILMKYFEEYGMTSTHRRNTELMKQCASEVGTTVARVKVGIVSWHMASILYMFILQFLLLFFCKDIQSIGCCFFMMSLFSRIIVTPWLGDKVVDF